MGMIADEVFHGSCAMTKGILYQVFEGDCVESLPTLPTEDSRETVRCLIRSLAWSKERLRDWRSGEVVVPEDPVSLFPKSMQIGQSQRVIR